MNWRTHEDLPLNPPHRLIDKVANIDLSPNIIERSLDELIPRGGKKPDKIAVSLEEYLSRVAMLSRKIKGVKHRKSCWDKITHEHLAKMEAVSRDDEKKHIEDPLPPGAVMTCSISLRDVRLENEFEVLIYSIRNSLTMLTILISAFLKGTTDLRSHSKLQKYLNTNRDWPTLKSIVNNACHSWIDDLTARRDAATHYVALTVNSSITKKTENSVDTIIHERHVSIPKQPVQFVSVWSDDIPAQGGTSHSSVIVANSDGNIIEAHGIFDSAGNLLTRRNGKLPESPEVIDGQKYFDKIIGDYENYLVEVLSELRKKIC